MVAVTDLVRLPDVLAATGVTYRQLDYWTRTGLVHPATPALPGSGYARGWHPDEVRVLAVLARLVAGGIAPHVSARLARDLVEQGWAELAPATPGRPPLEVVLA